MGADLEPGNNLCAVHDVYLSRRCRKCDEEALRQEREAAEADYARARADGWADTDNHIVTVGAERDAALAKVEKLETENDDLKVALSEAYEAVRTHPSNTAVLLQQRDALRMQVATIRAQALEEAARVCDARAAVPVQTPWSWTLSFALAAAAIRALAKEGGGE